jgi:hypothetical protein
MQTKRMETQPSFVMFKPPKLQVPINRLRSIKDIHLNLGWGADWCRRWDHL